MKQKPLLRKTPMKRTSFKSEPKPASGAKQKKCKVRTCRKPFTPDKPFIDWCSDDCAVVLAQERIAKQKAKAQRKERAADKAKKNSLKTRADWMKETQAALNTWVRTVRDAGKVCISCGRHHEGQLHAGHYLSRGARPNLALEEMNIHLQCQPCNVHLSGNQVRFRLGLIMRYGVEMVERLESDHEPRKYTIEQLQEMKRHYQKLVREHKKENAN